MMNTQYSLFLYAFSFRGSVNISENKIGPKTPVCDMVMRCFGYGKVCVSIMRRF